MVRSLSRSRSNSGVMKSALSRSTPIKKTTEPESPKSFGERWSSALLGVKGSSLTRNYEFEENPMARLKLLLVRRLRIDCNHLLTTCACCVPYRSDCIIPYTAHSQFLHNAHTCDSTRTASQAQSTHQRRSYRSTTTSRRPYIASDRQRPLESFRSVDTVAC